MNVPTQLILGMRVVPEADDAGVIDDVPDDLLGEVQQSARTSSGRSAPVANSALQQAVEPGDQRVVHARLSAAGSSMASPSSCSSARLSWSHLPVRVLRISSRRSDSLV